MLYWEFHERGFQQAVRTADWKGIRLEQDQPIELYNLKKDLGETNDLAAQNPELVQQMEKLMEKAHTPLKN